MEWVLIFTYGARGWTDMTLCYVGHRIWRFQGGVWITDMVTFHFLWLWDKLNPFCEVLFDISYSFAPFSALLYKQTHLPVEELDYRSLVVVLCLSWGEWASIVQLNKHQCVCGALRSCAAAWLREREHVDSALKLTWQTHFQCIYALISFLFVLTCQNSLMSTSKVTLTQSNCWVWSFCFVVFTVYSKVVIATFIRQDGHLWEI